VNLLGYQRPDGQIGIRNRILVLYTVHCAEEVCRKIVMKAEDASMAGWRSCHSNPFAIRKLIQLGCHQNIGGVLVVSHGCECTDAHDLLSAIQATGKPAKLMTIQEVGGTLKTIEKGLRLIRELKQEANVPRVPITIADLVIGLECGGSDTTSGLGANPAVGLVADQWIVNGGRTVFEEVGEMWGCEQEILERAATPAVREKIKVAFDRTREWATANGVEMFSDGNLAGGLTNIIEKSLGAVIKTGSTPIVDVLDSLAGDQIKQESGAYLVDSAMYRGLEAYGTSDVTDPIGVTELIAAGAHIVLFTTGRGSVTGSGISPVIKICANPQTYDRMQDDMDINAGAIIRGQRTIPQVGEEIYQEILQVAAGKQTKSELLEHFEYHI
jgi:altronate dehydratase large subunit